MGAGVEATFLDDALCPECSYSLRGLTGERCPECGTPLESLRSPQSRIPWVQRRTRGVFPAYWQTVLFVMFSYRRFRAEIVRPVNLRDAQTFRWTVVLIAWLSLLAVWPLWRVVHPRTFQLHAATAPATLNAAVALGLLAFLALLSGVHTYFFHPWFMPRILQNRAVALSYYMIAPLALMPVLVAVGAVGVWLGLRANFKIDELAVAVAAAMLALIGVPWILDLVRLADALFHRGPYTLCVAGGTIAACVLLALWIVGFLLTLAYALRLVGLAIAV